MSTNEERAIGWDENRIANPKESDFCELPPGKYPYEVIKLERGQHNGSEKLSACPKAIITLLVDGGELGQSRLTTNLFLHTKTMGLLCEFFVSIGLRKKGDDLVLAWNNVVGRTGLAQLDIEEYQGKKYTRVKRFLDPPETFGNAAPVAQFAHASQPAQKSTLPTYQNQAPATPPVNISEQEFDLF